MTAYGLFVEHYQKTQVIWNGERGRTIMFQNEMPYDPPSQEGWRPGPIKGYPAYKVADSSNRPYGRFSIHNYFLGRALDLLRPGGVLVVCDHLTDPDPGRADHHERLERARDRSHTRSRTGGQIVDLFAAAGLSGITMIEEPYDLDFDEWFDRGSPDATKDEVRAALLNGPPVRGFTPNVRDDASIRILGIRAIVRGVKPGPTGA